MAGEANKDEYDESLSCGPGVSLQMITEPWQVLLKVGVEERPWLLCERSLVFVWKKPGLSLKEGEDLYFLSQLHRRQAARS